MTTLDKICETVADSLELADDTTIKLRDLMVEFGNSPQGRRMLMRQPAFSKLWNALGEAVDRNGGFEPESNELTERLRRDLDREQRRQG